MSLHQEFGGIDIHASVVPETDVDASKFIATALIVRALRAADLRHVLVGAPCAIGITGVDPSIGAAVADAARDLLKKVGKDRYGFGTVVHDHTGRRSRATATLDGLIDTLQSGVRLCCIYTADENVPAAYKTVADGIAVLPPVDADLVRAACLRTVGRAPSPRELKTLGRLPVPLLSVALSKGRSLAQGVALARRLMVAQLEEAGKETETVAQAPVVPPGPKLEDLHGLGEAAAWGLSLAADLADYQAGRIGWDDVDRGALISGPPGTGKTTFALAVGRTCGVPVFVHSFARWQAAGYLNDMLKAMRKAFQEAQGSAPCILFVDEVDSVGDRTKIRDQNASYATQVINAFLECLDGAEARTGVVVIGATNHPDQIDEAIRRPGRLDRDLRIALPDGDARVGIMRHHLRGSLESADLMPLAARLEGASGADIEQTVRDARRLARRERRALTVADLKASMPPQVTLSDAAFHRVCVHEAGHLVVGTILGAEAGMVPIVARVQREVGRGTNAVTEFRRVEGFDRTRASYLAEITILLAGISAEETVLGSRGDGSGGMPGSDLHRATDLAARLEGSYGLGANLVHLSSDMPGRAADAAMRVPSLRLAIGVVLDDCMDRARLLTQREIAAIRGVAKTLSACGIAEKIERFGDA